MRDLRDRYADEIRARFPDIPRRVSGYNLDELLPEKGFNVARALVGSEGTLATVLEATVRLVHSPPSRSLLVLGYEEIFRAADHVPEILEYGPTGLEGLDQRLVDDMIAQGMHESEVPLLPDGAGWLLVEFGGDSDEEADQRARDCMKRLGKDSDAPSMKLFDDESEEQKLWEVREAGLGATAYVPGERDHWPGWEDAAVPPERLGDYLREFKDLLGKHDYRAAVYGHFGDGCVHCRIDFDLRTAEGLRNWRSFLDDAADLVVSYGGSLSGEHGDGQQRAELLPKMYGEELTKAFQQMKAIWDPDNRMNPHKVVDPYPIVSNMKLGADYAPLGAEDALRLSRGRRELRPRRAPLRGRRQMPRDRQRHDVPQLHGDQGGDAHDPRSRPDPLRDAGGGRHHRRLPLGRGGGGPRPLPLLQGVQGRLPRERRHGHLQGRVPLRPLQAPAAAAGGVHDGADHDSRAAGPVRAAARQLPHLGARDQPRRQEARRDQLAAGDAALRPPDLQVLVRGKGGGQSER